MKKNEEDCTCTDECLGYLTMNCKEIETLEEAAERILLEEDLDLSDYDKRHILKAMINIAKWQQKRSYSEEEVNELLKMYRNYY